MKARTFPYSYEERIFVWQSLPIAIGILIILLVMTSTRNMDGINCFKFAILIISFILLLLFFLNNYSINIRITDNKILIGFGIGLVKDSIDIASVRDIKIHESIFMKQFSLYPVKYPAGSYAKYIDPDRINYGIGFGGRIYAKFLYPDRMNYSVGFGSAVELILNDNKVVLISTNHPGEFTRYIMSVRPDLDNHRGPV